jgi:hypothetical protein
MPADKQTVAATTAQAARIHLQSAILNKTAIAIPRRKAVSINKSPVANKRILKKKHPAMSASNSATSAKLLKKRRINKQINHVAI